MPADCGIGAATSLLRYFFKDLSHISLLLKVQQDFLCRLIRGQFRCVYDDVRIDGSNIGIINTGDALDLVGAGFGIKAFAVPLLTDLQTG